MEDIHGYYFRLEYHININKNKDIIGYKLNGSTLIQASTNEEGIEHFWEDDYFIFLHEDVHKVNDTTVYLDKYTAQFEYCPNKLFEEFHHSNWDIDDFGDDDEGWDDYHEVNKYENQRYEESIKKYVYEGFIVSTDEKVINEVLNKIIKEFCKVNDINYMEGN